MSVCMPVHAKVARVGSIDCATKVIHIIIIEPRHGNPTFHILENKSQISRAVNEDSFTFIPSSYIINSKPLGSSSHHVCG